MASILKPFANIIRPGTYQVPIGPLAVDRTHAFALGMIGCWVPGVMQGQDLIDPDKVMTYDTASTFNATLDGPGQKSNVAGTNCGQYWIINSASDPFLTAVNTGGPGGTLFWRGAYTGTQDNFGYLCGVIYDVNANTDPFAVWTIDWDNAGHIQGRVNIGGVGGGFAWGAIVPTANVMFDVAISVPTNNTGLLLYLNGVVSAGGNNTTGALNNYPTKIPAIVIGRNNTGSANTSGMTTNLFAAWNRTLTAAELMALHLDPYAFLIPAEADMSIMRVPPAPTTVFRRTLSKLGTRTGSRQAHMS